MQVLLPNSSRIVHFETKNRVRDWKKGAHGCAAHRRQWIARGHRTPRTDVGRADVLAFGKEIATVDTALLNRQSNSCLRSPQGLQILGDPIILNRRNGRRRSGVCQTPATAKKKKPDGIPRNGRKGQNQRIPLPASFIMRSAAKVHKKSHMCKFLWDFL